MRFHVDIYDSSCSGRRPHVISDLPLQLLPSSALSSSLWLSLSSRFSLRSSVLSPRVPLLLFWFLLLLPFVVLLLQLLLPLHAMLVVVVFLFFFLHKADVSSTDIAPHVSGRSPQTLRIVLQRRLRDLKDTSKTSGRQLIWLDVLQTEIVRVQSRIARVLAHQRVSAFAVLPILRHGRGLPAVFAAKPRRRMQLWAKAYSSSSSRGS